MSREGLRGSRGEIGQNPRGGDVWVLFHNFPGLLEAASLPIGLSVADVAGVHRVVARRGERLALLAGRDFCRFGRTPDVGRRFCDVLYAVHLLVRLRVHTGITRVTRPSSALRIYGLFRASIAGRRLAALWLVLVLYPQFFFGAVKTSWIYCYTFNCF